jgi:hypothetical protein
MLLLLASAAASPQPPAPIARVEATASVRIEHSATATRKSWEQLPKGSRKEVVIRDERGRPVLVRIVDYE